MRLKVVDHFLGGSWLTIRMSTSSLLLHYMRSLVTKDQKIPFAELPINIGETICIQK